LHLSLPTSGAFLDAQLSGDDLADRIGKAEGPKGGDSSQR
jgi:acetolactate decarboxylase